MRSGSRWTSRIARRVEQGLTYTRIGNPIGSAEIDRSVDAPHDSRGSADGHAGPSCPQSGRGCLRRGGRHLPPTSRRDHRDRSDRAGHRVRLALEHLGRPRVPRSTSSPTRSRRCRSHGANSSACCCAIDLRRSGCCSASYAPVAVSSCSIPSSGRNESAHEVVDARPPLDPRRTARSRIALLTTELRHDARRRRCSAPPTAFGAESRRDLTISSVASPAHPDQLRPDTAIRLLTSGTTGPPKRSDLTFADPRSCPAGAKHYESAKPRRCRTARGQSSSSTRRWFISAECSVCSSRSWTVAASRCSSGSRSTTGSIGSGGTARRRRASCRRRCAWCSMPDRSRRSRQPQVGHLGTAPLSPDTAEAFTEKYGVAVLTNYAATEFGGAVAGWNLADHRHFWTVKRGSVGRAHPGCALRVVDEATGAVLRPVESVYSK